MSAVTQDIATEIADRIAKRGTDDWAIAYTGAIDALRHRLAHTAPAEPVACAICDIANQNHYLHLAPFDENYHDFVPSLTPAEPTDARIAELEAALRETIVAMRTFCDRVEAGEVRSKRTYETFKAILARTTLAGGRS